MYSDRLSKLVNHICHVWDEQAAEHEGKMRSLANSIVAEHEAERYNTQKAFKNAITAKNNEITALVSECKKLKSLLSQFHNENKELQRKLQKANMKIESLRSEFKLENDDASECSSHSVQGRAFNQPQTDEFVSTYMPSEDGQSPLSSLGGEVFVAGDLPTSRTMSPHTSYYDHSQQRSHPSTWAPQHQHIGLYGQQQQGGRRSPEGEHGYYPPGFSSNNSAKQQPSNSSGGPGLGGLFTSQYPQKPQQSHPQVQNLVYGGRYLMQQDSASTHSEDRMGDAKITSSNGIFESGDRSPSMSVASHQSSVPSDHHSTQGFPGKLLSPTAAPFAPPLPPQPSSSTGAFDPGVSQLETEAGSRFPPPGFSELDNPVDPGTESGAVEKDVADSNVDGAVGLINQIRLQSKSSKLDAKPVSLPSAHSESSDVAGSRGEQE
mmetsp:Transcript_14396/g.21582  ORF Transcript_14396/g.21582 Transcript_14396/m.21582 type:complete len:434 (+) Transcript_14396:213-1514(+)|eukprot:CAMPEP_0185027512 /NCGR_PEP_ID=MMETSP1103-20130426/12645_1 /TAXON_ID=36769 /ORGANISM="Paraphysomonas bandaiensis, Strain Caron Lab Isolate" /LENGTH=433 /DNA_ID=CAMNT_0027561543 /DNA_START=149 /DNA_END=1450 /DNA_ORIENTATION=-